VIATDPPERRSGRDRKLTAHRLSAFNGEASSPRRIRSKAGSSVVFARITSGMKATLEEVEKGAAEYLHRVIDGETVVVYREGRPVAEIRPVAETETLRPVGLAAGEFVVTDDFDDPLPDDLLDAFEGR
jgi:antitoxin (DNA-binding transcriptional repressor) of toxin-antitoxin stability system